MIVVAIIGLLASIAIPNFLSFQCRAKQSEARSQLGTIFSVEKVFLSEHNTYTTDFVALGWTPDGSPLYVYGYGAGVEYPDSVSGMTDYDKTLRNTTVAGVIGTPPRWDTSRSVDLAGDVFDDADFPATACAGQSFIVAAVGDIKPDSTLGLDRWVIDNNRFLSFTANDCFNLI